MSEFFKSIISISPPFNMIVLVVLFGSASTAIATLVTQIRKYASHRQELEFKRDLVERGLGAEEIERVLQARSPGVGSD